MATDIKKYSLYGCRNKRELQERDHHFFYISHLSKMDLPVKRPLTNVLTLAHQASWSAEYGERVASDLAALTVPDVTVDLRENSGGDLGLMLSAIHPLLPLCTTLAVGTDRDGKVVIRYRLNRKSLSVRTKGENTQTYSLFGARGKDNSPRKVGRILVSRQTGSAGAMIALILKATHPDASLHGGPIDMRTVTFTRCNDTYCFSWATFSIPSIISFVECPL